MCGRDAETGNEGLGRAGGRVGNRKDAAKMRRGKCS